MEVPVNRGGEHLYTKHVLSGISIGDTANIVEKNNSTMASGIAIGDYSQAVGRFSLGLGGYAQATGHSSMAIGGVARASGFNSLAMMRQSAANGDFSTAIGTVADAEGNGSFAMGYSSTAKGDQSIAIGAATPKKINNPGVTSVPRAEYVTEDNTVTEGARSIALGTGARTAAGADDSMAFGANARTSGANAVAIGNAAKAQQENTVAIGNQADASAASAFAIGSGAKGTGENAMALGVGANAGANALAIGQGTSAKATGVALGTGAAAEENAAAVGANSNAKEDSLALGAGATSESEGFALGASSHAETSGMALGKESNAGTGATAIGLSAKATGENAIVIGKGAQATGTNTISIGTGNIVSGEGSGAIGDPTTVIGHGTYTLGNDNGTIVANNSGVFGNNNTITGAIEGVRVIGNNNTAAAGNVMIMGNGAKASGTDSISIGNGAVAQGEGTQDGTGLSNSTIAIGTRAQALEQGDIVIGRDAKGIASDKHGNTGSGVVVVGADAAAYGSRGDVAIGASAETNVKIKQSGGVSSNDYAQSVAIGSTAKTYGTQALALGSDTRAIGNSSIAIGGDDIDKARGVLEAAVPQLVSGNGIQKTFNREIEADPNLQDLGTAGPNPDGKYASTAAIGDATTSIGMLSEAYGTGSTAIGINSLTKGTASTGIGIMARSWGTNSLAMGSQVGAYGNQSTSIGNSNIVGGDMTNGDISGLNSSAVGAENTVYGNNSYAFGGSNTVGSATITTTDSANGHDTDKINTVSGAVLGNQAVALGYQNRVTADNAYAIGSGNTLSGQNGVIIGKDNTVSAANSGVIGNNNDNRHTNITVEDTYAIGNNNGTINAARSNVFGNNNDLSSTGAEGAHIVGNDNSVTAQGGQVWGNFSKATAADAIVIGSNATADQANSVSLGSNSTTQTVTSTASAAMNGVTKNFAGGTASGTVSVGSSDVPGGTTGQGLTGFKRTVTNVAAGRISDTSTDAINGSQLYGLQTEVERGLNFSGDTASGATNKFNRTLGSEVKVVGGMTAKANLTDGNIGVVSNGTDTLEVKLSKDLHLGTNGSVSAGNTTITSRGITTNGGIRLTNNGIDAGNHVISNVASGGTVDSNAANIGDLKKASSSVAAGTNIASVDGAPSASGTVYTVNAKGAAVAAGTNTHVSTQEDAGTHVTTYTVAADKTTVSAKPAGTDGLGVVVTGTPATDGSGVVTTDYAVDLNADTKAAINNSATNIANNSTNITKLQGGFTVSNEAGTKQDIALGGDAKQNIQFKGEADKIDVSVEHAADGATVTVKADPNLGQNIDISNNSTVNNLKAGFDLKAGSTTSNVALGGTKPTVEFATADDTMTVGLDGTKVTYGIDKTKLAQNITGDMINNINNATTTPITNISAQFGVTAESGNQKTVTLKKDTTPIVKFEGDGKYITSAMTNDGVKYSIDETQLNDTISNNTTVQKNKTDITNINNTIDKGLSFGGDSGAVINKKLGQEMDVKGGATGTLSDNNIGVVSDGTQLNVKLAKTVTGLDSVTAGTAVMGKDASGKSYVTGLDNKDWDVTNPTAVSGRAATEDQLKKLNDSITTATAAKTDYRLIKNPSSADGSYTVTNNKVDLQVKDEAHPAAAAQTVTIKDVASASDVEKLDDRAVKYDKNTDGTVNKDKVTLEGTDGTTLTNVKDGVVNATSKDAVNGSQLYKVDQKVEQNTTNIAGNTTNINSLKGGFTVSNEAGTKQDIALGGDAKQNIQFKGEADKIDVSVEHAADGATVTVKADPNLGQNIDISNNSTVNNLKAGFDLKAGSTTSNVALGGTKPTVEFATADDTMTVGLDGTKVTYGIDKTKLAQNITGDMINNINNATTTPITNISAQFGVTAESGNQKTVTLKKDTTPIVKFEGDGKYITSAMTNDGVKYSIDETQLNDTISNNTTVQKNKTDITNINNTIDKGLSFGGDSGAVINKKLGQEMDVKGGATGTLSDNNIGVVSDGTQLNVKLAKTVTGLDSVTAGTAVMGKDASGKSYVTGLDNKDWDVTNPTAVSGRAATEDQLKKLNDTLTSTSAAKTDYSLIANPEAGSNGEYKVTNNQVDLKVKDANHPDAAVKTVTIKDIASASDVEKLNDRAVKYDKNTDGTVNKDKVTLEGGTNGTQLSNVASGLGTTPLKDADGDTLKNAANIGDLQNAVNNTATELTDKGLKFGANSGTAVTNKLGSQVTVKGAGTKDDTQYSGDNIKTKISQDGDGNTTIDVMMDKDITADNVTVGKAGTDGKDGHIGVNGKDGVSGVGIDGKDGISVKGDKGEVGINGNDGISVKGKDGKDGVTIKGEDGVDGVDGPEGHIGLNGKDGMTDIWTKPGAPGLDGADGTTMTRVVYKDPKGTEHQVATLDDGMKYSGDTGTQLKMKLNTNVNVKGGVTDADKLTEGNIGVVTDGTDTLNIRLAKELKGLTSVTTGNTIMNNSGVTIANTDPKKTVSLTDGGLNNGGNKITNVADGVDGKDAVNKDQLDAVKAAATTKVEEGTNTTVTESTDPATQAKTYTVDLKPTVTLGTDPAKQVTLDGNTGTVKAGQVTVNGATGTVNNLTNRTWTPGNITSGQAATEDQLKAATDSTATALTDKGLKFGANSGTAVTNKLGSQVTVKGAGTKDDTQYSGDNIKTKISQDGDGNTTIDVMMDKDITADNVTVGKAGTDGKDGHIGVNGKDGVSGVGIDGKDGISVKGDKGEVGINGNDGISVKGKDGKDGVTIKGEDGVDGVDGPEGHIGLNGKDGMTDIWTKPGAPGLDGADGTTMTRVVYKDPKGTEHQVATLDDGMKYSGDTGTQLKMKLNTNVNVKGGVTDADKLTEGNIGVVTDGTDTLNIRLAKELKGLTSVTTGNTIMNNSGVTIANTDPKKTVSLTDGGLNNGGNKITNVADGVDGKDAVNKGQLDKAIESAKTTVSAGTNIKVEHTGNGPTDYKVSLNKDVDLGNDGSLKVGDTTVNKDGVKVGDKVTVDKDGFKIKDGPSVTTSGINAGNKQISNVASGSDGIDPSGHKTYNTDTNGANIGDIKDITKAATQELTDKGLKFGANSGTAVTNKLGSQVDVVGSEAKADHEYSADNLTTEVSQDSSGKTTITVKMDKAITADNVTVGKAGADGKDGTIGVNGKDGSAVVINGKDGSIGLNGKDGANGMTIKGADGKVGVDGKDGTTRLVYETKDGDKTVVHEVATMDDGMKYAGDDGQTDTNKVISKKLNNTVDIIGGADSTKLTDKNIGVNNVDGKLKVQLSSDITGLNSISTKTVNATESMTIGSGSGATTIKSYKEDGSNATTLDVGGSRISNVAPGEKDTDAATVGQLNQNNAAIANSINNLGGEIQDVGANAAALAGLKPIQYDPLEPTQIMAAVGNYRNSTAAAVGVAHYTREDLMFHAGATVGTKHNMFNAGVTWKFGPASRKAAVPEQYKAGPISASYVMQDEVRALKAENDALRKDNEQTKAALEDVLKRLAALETKK